MHELKGPPHSKRNFIIIIIIIVVHFIHVHWSSPSHKGILLQTDVLTNTPQPVLSALFPFQAYTISYQDDTQQVLWWKGEFQNTEFQKWALTVLFFYVCIYTNAQSSIAS